MPTHATVLIVDDDAGVREALVEILRPTGYRALTAATVQEAEEARRQVTPGGIDVVIANINLTADPKLARAMRCGTDRHLGLHAPDGARPAAQPGWLPTGSYRWLGSEPYAEMSVIRGQSIPPCQSPGLHHITLKP
jgi:hypothetical protein